MKKGIYQSQNQEFVLVKYLNQDLFTIPFPDLSWATPTFEAIFKETQVLGYSYSCDLTMYLESRRTKRQKKFRKTRRKIEKKKRSSDDKMADVTSENQSKHPTEN